MTKNRVIWFVLLAIGLILVEENRIAAMKQEAAADHAKMSQVWTKKSGWSLPLRAFSMAEWNNPGYDYWWPTPRTDWAAHYNAGSRANGKGSKTVSAMLS